MVHASQENNKVIFVVVFKYHDISVSSNSPTVFSKIITSVTYPSQLINCFLDIVVINSPV
jgi:hypothetical protein